MSAALRDRFRTVRKMLKLNQEKFGTNLGEKQSSITDIERGRKNVSIEIMEILHKKFFINLNWLICGIGEVKYDNAQFDWYYGSRPDYLSNVKLLIDAQRETIEAQKKIIAELEAKVKKYENS